MHKGPVRGGGSGLEMFMEHSMVCAPAKGAQVKLEPGLATSMHRIFLAISFFFSSSVVEFIRF